MDKSFMRRKMKVPSAVKFFTEDNSFRVTGMEEQEIEIAVPSTIEEALSFLSRKEILAAIANRLWLKQKRRVMKEAFDKLVQEFRQPGE